VSCFERFILKAAVWCGFVVGKISFLQINLIDDDDDEPELEAR
jgi:hypothetical protein